MLCLTTALSADAQRRAVNVYLPNQRMAGNLRQKSTAARLFVVWQAQAQKPGNQPGLGMVVVGDELQKVFVGQIRGVTVHLQLELVEPHRTPTDLAAANTAAALAPTRQLFVDNLTQIAQLDARLNMVGRDISKKSVDPGVGGGIVGLTSASNSTSSVSL